MHLAFSYRFSQFPSFDGEKFLSEGVIWARIAHDGYKLRFFNSIIYVCDYLPDGLTKNYNNLFVKNPQGFGLLLAQDIALKTKPSYALRDDFLRYYNHLKGHFTKKQIASFLGMWTSRFVVLLIYIKMGKKIKGWFRKR